VTLHHTIFVADREGKVKTIDEIVAAQVKVVEKTGIVEVTSEEYGPLQIPLHNVNGIQLKEPKVEEKVEGE
jgi:hypothetical protein